MRKRQHGKIVKQRCLGHKSVRTCQALADGQGIPNPTEYNDV